MLKRRTDSAISDLVEATYGEQGGPRLRHVFREALLGLVRLAKVEQLMDMRLDSERAAGSMAGASQRRQTRALLRKIGMDVHSGQRKLQFEWKSAEDDCGGLPCPDVENDCGKP